MLMRRLSEERLWGLRRQSAEGVDASVGEGLERFRADPVQGWMRLGFFVFSSSMVGRGPAPQASLLLPRQLEWPMCLMKLPG